MKTTDLTLDLRVTKISDFHNLPADAIIITYSDHYRGNSGDDLYYTDSEGKLDFYELGECPDYWHWHKDYEDRGIQTMHAITSERGGLYAFRMFRTLCKRYVQSSNDLKNFTITNLAPRDSVVIDREDLPAWFQEKYLDKCDVQYVPTPKYFNESFYKSEWYRRFKNIAKQETIEAKKEEYENELNKYNKTIEEVLIKIKQRASKWFFENNISISVAYSSDFK